MLSRVARQRNVSLQSRLSHGRMASLPSQTILRLYSQTTRPSSIANTSPTLPQERPRRPSFQSNRNLATTSDQTVIDKGSFMPLEESTYSIGRQPGESNDLHASPMFSTATPDPFDTSSLIILSEPLETKPRLFRKIKGIGGDEQEMLANLDISLKVGRFDRAASLITRLGHHYAPNSSEYLAIHNRFLEAMVMHMIMTRQHSIVPTLQRWFEVDMPSGGVQPDAATVAIMLKMCLRMRQGPRRDREVRKYWSIAKNDDVEEEVLVHPILGELELGELSEICSDDLRRLSIDSTGLDSDTVQPQLETGDGAYVRSVEQKGLGLSSLKESLSIFNGRSHVPFPEDLEGTEEEKAALYRQLRQRRLEADSVMSALDRWRHEFGEAQRQVGLDAGSGKRISRTMSEWSTELISAIKKELELVEEAEKNQTRTKIQAERCEYGVFLRVLSPEKLAAVAILSAMSVFSTGGMSSGIKITTLVSNIGKDVQDEITAEASIRRASGLNQNNRRLNLLRHLLSTRKKRNGRMRWKALVQNLEVEDPSFKWPSTITMKVGAALLGLLFDIAKVPVLEKNHSTNKSSVVMQPAFHHSHQVTWGKRVGVIHVNSELVKMMTREPVTDFMARHLPMVSQPRKWDGWKDGGFYSYDSPLVRVTPGETLQPNYVRTALESHGLEKVRKGLDVLGNTEWRVNQGVLDVMLEAWNSGKPIANLAPAEPDLPHPPRPAPEDGVEKEKEWARAVRGIEDARAGMHSNRCFQNFQLEVANAYRKEVFYLPHNMDFRGRAYPLPPYLNQMGADNCRGLLLFSEAKPLGERGLRWLKIQLANLYGFDKASFSEREQFVMDHLDDVFDSADNGLRGRRWWLEAADPWQCLAACLELRNAFRLPDPTQFASSLPIHQDGSCNGLQHYAALGGDIVGAQQVNLEPSDRPSDVYTAVAEFVKQEISREAALGDVVAQRLRGKITRKIVKQTVMTNVYGVTFHGAMQQVAKQLDAYYPDLEESWMCAKYIAAKIFQALGSMFTGAHDIQYWLGDCASRITHSLSPEQIESLTKEALSPKSPKSKGKSKPIDPADEFKSTVVWTTPLGLPVVQPYRSRKSRRIYTTLQEISVADATSDAPVSKRKQLQAFPPNFIHSLDATHMMLSANTCHEMGLTFSAVHDSFWTHACDIDSMNLILRDAFVNMHSDDIIKRLAAEFEVRYGNNLFLAKVRRSSPIGRQIGKLRTEVGKKVKTHELIEEYRRQTLLSSEDPAQQAEGRAMRTPAAIFEEMNGADDDLLVPRSLGESAVGHIPEDTTPTQKSTSVDMNDPAIESLFSTFDGRGKSPTIESSTSGDGCAANDAEALEGEEAAVDQKKKKQKHSDVTWLWLPLTFRHLPAKGDWDVSRIRSSPYFFS